MIDYTARPKRCQFLRVYSSFFLPQYPDMCSGSISKKVAADMQVTSSMQAGSEAQLAMQANQMWFVDSSGGEALTFREVFLKSDALEHVVAGMCLAPAWS